jgi:Flp pilus assembly protein TadD
VLRVRPEDAGAHNKLGNVLAQQGKHEEAARQFEETLRLKPDRAGACNNLAVCQAGPGTGEREPGSVGGAAVGIN